MSEPYLGEIRAFGFDFAPRGWASCDGQLLLISNFSALFSILGTTYGGDGQVNFALPDLRGRAPMHAGSGGGLTRRVLGERLGAEGETLDISQVPGHTHDVYGTNGAATETDPTGQYFAVHRDHAAYHPTADTTTAPTTSTGGAVAHNNMMPFQTINFCIAYTGTFPSRN